MNTFFPIAAAAILAVSSVSHAAWRPHLGTNIKYMMIKQNPNKMDRIYITTTSKANNTYDKFVILKSDWCKSSDHTDNNVQWQRIYAQVLTALQSGNRISFEFEDTDPISDGTDYYRIQNYLSINASGY